MRIAAFTRHLFSVRSTDVPSPKLVQKRADGRPAIENRMRNGSSSASLDSIAEDLDRLAAVAWRVRGAPHSSSFLFDPSSLPPTANTQGLEQALGLLYDHAKVWAPGFDIPFRVPKVRLPLLSEAPGVYRVDEDGYVFVDISPTLLQHPRAVLAVLAHEACHHILDLSGFNTHQSAVDEPLTDLAMFVCGFGQVFLDGRTDLVSSDNQWRKTHLGYLSEAEYRFAYQWVLQSASRGRSVGPNVKPKEEYQLGFLRNKALVSFGGNVTALERLLEHERQRRPGCDEMDILTAVVDQLERDRR